MVRAESDPSGGRTARDFGMASRSGKDAETARGLCVRGRERAALGPGLQDKSHVELIRNAIGLGRDMAPG